LKEKREQKIRAKNRMSQTIAQAEAKKAEAPKTKNNTNTQTNELKKILWECKDCHSMIGSHETIAYHLVDRILYGWCEPCFNNRPDIKTQAA
jgi:hypothetical protein